MILSYKDLRKREVVNIADGRSFGKITDLKIDFPCGNLKGIVVIDRKRCGFLCLFNKTEIFIDEKHIVRIGGDVILVNVKTVDALSTETVEMSACKTVTKPRAPVPPCPPSPCPPPFPAPHPPKSGCAQKETATFGGEEIYAGRINIDAEDY